MPTPSPMIVAFLVLITSLAHVQTGDDHASDRAYIGQAESDWAESVVTNDVGVLERPRCVGRDSEAGGRSAAASGRCLAWK